MTLHWGMGPLSSILSQSRLNHLNTIFVDPNCPPGVTRGLSCFNGITGELLFISDTKKPVRISRRKLKSFLAEGLSIQNGRELASIEQSPDQKMHVHLKDGGVITGDVVIGADGARSKVREHLVGPRDNQLTDIPMSMFNFTSKVGAETAKKIRALNPLFIAAFHPNNGDYFWLSVQDAQDPNDPENWVFQFFVSWSDYELSTEDVLNTKEGRMRFFKKRATSYCEPWRSAALAVDESLDLRLDKGAYWGNARRFDNHGGRVTICGDAAHPMTPHRGQGLNNALLDASNIVSALYSVADGEKSFQEAIDGYDAEMIQRGKLEMEVSYKQTMMVHNWDMVMDSPMAKYGTREVKADMLQKIRDISVIKAREVVEV